MEMGPRLFAISCIISFGARDNCDTFEHFRNDISLDAKVVQIDSRVFNR